MLGHRPVDICSDTHTPQRSLTEAHTERKGGTSWGSKDLRRHKGFKGVKRTDDRDLNEALIVTEKDRLVSSVGRASVCCAGGRRFEP